MKTTIPFQGFYGSIHDGQFDYVIESIADENVASDNTDPNDSGRIAFNEWYNAINWEYCFNEYAQAYCDAFAYEINIDVKFTLLDKPKYYNFETDRIIAEIALSEVERIFWLVDKPKLKAYIKEQFTSRDGFASFYPNDLANWPDDLSTWDLNHIGTLLAVYAEQEGFNEVDLIDSANLYEVAGNLIG